MSNVFETYHRAEKRLRMRAVDSFWRIFDRLINESLPPYKCLWYSQFYQRTNNVHETWREKANTTM